jgi:hypothetical protein
MTPAVYAPAEIAPAITIPVSKVGMLSSKKIKINPSYFPFRFQGVTVLPAG